MNVGLASSPAEGSNGEAHVPVGRVVVSDTPVEVRLGYLGSGRGVPTLKIYNANYLGQELYIHYSSIRKNASDFFGFPSQYLAPVHKSMLNKLT